MGKYPPSRKAPERTTKRTEGFSTVFFLGGSHWKKEGNNKHDNKYYLGGLSSLGDLSDMSQLAFMKGDVVGQYLASTAPSFA